MSTDMRNHSSDSLDRSGSHSSVEPSMLRRRSTSALHLVRQYDELASTDSTIDSGIQTSSEDHMKLLQNGHVRRPSFSSLRRRDPRPGGASSHHPFRRAASLEEDDMPRRPHCQLVLRPLYLPKAVQELRRCSTPQDNNTGPIEDGNLENRRSKQQQSMEPTSDSEQPPKTLRRRSRLSRPWSIPLPALSPVHDEPRRPSDPGPTTEAQASKSVNHWRASRTMSLVPLHTSKSPSPADLMLLQAVSDAAKSKRKLRGMRYEWHEEELEGFTSPILTGEPSSMSMEAVSSVASECSPFSGPLPNGILTYGSSIGSCISTDTSHCWCSPRSICVALRGTASSGSISTDGVPSLFGDNDPRAYHHPSGPQTPVSSNEDNLFSSLTNATFDFQGLPSIPPRPVSVHSPVSSDKHHDPSATDSLDVIDAALIIVRGTSTSPTRHWEEEEEPPMLASSSAHDQPSDLSSISLLDLNETDQSDAQEQAIERPRPSSQLERRTDTRDLALSSSSQSQCLPSRDILRRASPSSLTYIANFPEETVVKGQPLPVQLDSLKGGEISAHKQPTNHAIGQDHPHRTGLGPEVIHRRLRSMGETVDHVRLRSYQASVPPRPRTGLDRQRPHTRTDISVATERDFERSISVFEDEQESSSFSWRGKVATGQRHKTTVSSRLVQPLAMFTSRSRPSLSLTMPKRPSTSTGIVGATISRVASLSRPTAPPPRSPSSSPDSPAGPSPTVAASCDSMANRMKQLPLTPKTPSASLLSSGLGSGLGVGLRSDSNDQLTRSGSTGRSGKVKRDSIIDVFRSPRWRIDTSASTEQGGEGESLWTTESAIEQEGSRLQPTATAMRRRLTERMRR